MLLHVSDLNNLGLLSSDLLQRPSRASQGRATTDANAGAYGGGLLEAIRRSKELREEVVAKQAQLDSSELDSSQLGLLAVEASPAGGNEAEMSEPSGVPPPAAAPPRPETEDSYDSDEGGDDYDPLAYVRHIRRSVTQMVEEERMHRVHETSEYHLPRHTSLFKLLRKK